MYLLENGAAGDTLRCRLIVKVPSILPRQIDKCVLGMLLCGRYCLKGDWTRFRDPHCTRKLK